MSSLAGLKKDSFSRKSTDFGHFWLPRFTFKVDFLNIPANFLKTLGYVPGELGNVVRNIVVTFEVSVFRRFRGGGG